jgi:hypothetical protein
VVNEIPLLLSNRSLGEPFFYVPNLALLCSRACTYLGECVDVLIYSGKATFSISRISTYYNAGVGMIVRS